MSHILGVTSLVMEAGGDEAEVSAALLHDGLEAHGGQVRLDEIRVQFGDRVAIRADLVVEVSMTLASAPVNAAAAADERCVRYPG